MKRGPRVTARSIPTPSTCPKWLTPDPDDPYPPIEAAICDFSLALHRAMWAPIVRPSGSRARDEQEARRLQFERLLLLNEVYSARKRRSTDVQPLWERLFPELAPNRCWVNFALDLAAQLYPGLQIIRDDQAPRKPGRPGVWCSEVGRNLVTEVSAIKKADKLRTTADALRRVMRQRGFSSDEIRAGFRSFESRYYEALKHHGK
jgi:hypothetical protein